MKKNIKDMRKEVIDLRGASQEDIDKLEILLDNIGEDSSIGTIEYIYSLPIPVLSFNIDSLSWCHVLREQAVLAIALKDFIKKYDPSLNKEKGLPRVLKVQKNYYYVYEIENGSVIGLCLSDEDCSKNIGTYGYWLTINIEEYGGVMLNEWQKIIDNYELQQKIEKSNESVEDYLASQLPKKTSPNIDDEIKKLEDTIKRQDSYISDLMKEVEDKDIIIQHYIERTSKGIPSAL